MGLVHVTVSLRANENSRKRYEAVFLVDTGATDSMAPAKGLEKAGIKRRGRMAYELADGTTAEYDFGLASAMLTAAGITAHQLKDETSVADICREFALR